jgi:hypothetical protein
VAQSSAFSEVMLFQAIMDSNPITVNVGTWVHDWRPIMELPSKDSLMRPKKLYKYRKFDTSTLRLLSQGEVYYADPNDFNDPLDSRPVIRVDTDVPTLEKVCYRMLVLTRGKERALDSINNHRYMSEEYGDFRKDEPATNCYTQDLRQEIKGPLYDEMRKSGVLSLAARWDCPLMWSHYADEHRGLCIEYDVTGHKCDSLSKVDYTASGDIKVSDLFEWKLRGSVTAQQSVRNAFFYVKARQWRYEKEWRDVAGFSGAVDSPLTMSAVYFGLRCDDAVITSVVKLFSNAPVMVQFFEVYREDETFRLKRAAADVDRIEACGLRTSRRWDFDPIE